MGHGKIDEKSASELKVLKMVSEVVIFGEGKGRLGELGKIPILSGGQPLNTYEKYGKSIYSSNLPSHCI